MGMPNYPIESINKVALSEFQDWTDHFGMMQDNDKDVSSWNGNLFTAHYVFGLVSTNQMTDVERARIIQVFLNNCLVTGLLQRAPSINNRQAQDDMFGVMGAEALMYPNPKDRVVTKAMYEYGKQSCDGLASDANDQDKLAYKWLKRLTFRTRWVWNTEEPGKFKAGSWLGRFPNLIATMQMAQGKIVNPFSWLWWAITMMLLPLGKVDKNYHDGYTLRFHSALACQGYGFLTNWICKKVREAVARDYVDFGLLLGAYFAKPQHPIVKLCKGKY